MIVLALCKYWQDTNILTFKFRIPEDGRKHHHYHHLHLDGIDQNRFVYFIHQRKGKRQSWRRQRRRRLEGFVKNSVARPADRRIDGSTDRPVFVTQQMNFAASHGLGTKTIDYALFWISVLLILAFIKSLLSLYVMSQPCTNPFEGGIILLQMPPSNFCYFSKSSSHHLFKLRSNRCNTVSWNV